MNSISERSDFAGGAEHASALDQRYALQAIAQRVRLLPGVGPGPLMDQDGGEFDEPKQAVLRPLRAAPMPVFGRSPSAAVPAEAASQEVSGAAANSVWVAAPLSAETVCQHSVDLKAFTGKGEPRSVRQASKVVDDIHGQMRAVAQASAQLGKSVLYLTVHARSLTHQHSLRWRGYTLVGSKGGHKHLTWDEAAERIAAHPYGVAVQMQVWDAEARELNRVEQIARASLKRARAARAPDRRRAA